MILLSFFIFNVVFWIGAALSILSLVGLLVGPFVVVGIELYSEASFASALWDAGKLILVCLGLLVALLGPIAVFGWVGKASIKELTEIHEPLKNQHLNSISVLLPMAATMLSYWFSLVFGIVFVVSTFSIPIFVFFVIIGDKEALQDLLNVGGVLVGSFVLGWIFQKLAMLMNCLFENVVEMLTGSEFKAIWR